MQTKEEIMGLLREKRPYLAAKYSVKQIGLFGSFVKGAADETSDIDIIVEFERPVGFGFIELAEHLEHLLGRKVDVLTPDGLESIRVDHVAQDIRGSIVYV